MTTRGHEQPVLLGGSGHVDALTHADRSIGRGLARERRAAGLSRAWVAARAGLRVAALSRLEQGRGDPTVATVRRVLRAIRAGAKRGRSPIRLG